MSEKSFKPSTARLHGISHSQLAMYDFSVNNDLTGTLVSCTSYDRKSSYVVLKESLEHLVTRPNSKYNISGRKYFSVSILLCCADS